MPSEPRWITASQVIRLNELVIARSPYLERHLLKDRAMLESAVGRPTNRWHYGERDTGALAAQLLIGVARNHAFEQGNKRTALVAANAFLAAHDFVLDFPDHKLANLILAMLNRTMTDDGFEAAYRGAVRQSRRLRPRMFQRIPRPKR